MNQNKLVFFIDDDNDDLEIMAEVCLSAGCRYQLFTNSAEMFAALASQPEKPSIIYLDINMPMVNGYEVIQKFRAINDHRDIPLVIHSANCDEKCIAKCHELGANYYMVKASSYKGLKTAILNSLTKDWAAFKPERKNFLYEEDKLGAVG